MAFAAACAHHTHDVLACEACGHYRRGCATCRLCLDCLFVAIREQEIASDPPPTGPQPPAEADFGALR